MMTAQIATIVIFAVSLLIFVAGVCCDGPMSDGYFRDDPDPVSPAALDDVSRPSSTPALEVDQVSFEARAKPAPISNYFESAAGAHPPEDHEQVMRVR